MVTWIALTNLQITGHGECSMNIFMVSLKTSPNQSTFLLITCISGKTSLMQIPEHSMQCSLPWSYFLTIFYDGKCTEKVHTHGFTK